MIQIQQGDVVLQTTKIPQVKMERIADPIVQYGEHTGHKHKLMFRHGEGSEAQIPTCPQWEMFKQGNVRYLKVNDPTDLVHEEHKTITIPPGEYKIGIVREYDHFSEEAREVMD